MKTTLVFTLQLFHKPASRTIHRRILRTDENGTTVFHGRTLDPANGWRLVRQVQVSPRITLGYCERWFEEQENRLLLGDTKSTGSFIRLATSH